MAFAGPDGKAGRMLVAKCRALQVGASMGGLVVLHARWPVVF